MVAVITGDIINSRELENNWLDQLRESFGLLKNVKAEIFRGDSFQMVIKKQDALLQAIYTKACIKTIKNADVRLAIGLGKAEQPIKKVTEANGEAFVHSGLAFDNLKMFKTNLLIKTAHEKFDQEWNVIFRLALMGMDGWGQTAAEMVKYAIEHRDSNQAQLAKLSGRSQSSVSEALKRANFAEIMEMESLFRNKVSKLK